MDLRLQDKVILVTGGAKGIGAAIVRACAAENAKVVQAVGNFGKLDAGANGGVNDKVGLEHGNPNDCLLTVHNGPYCSRAPDCVGAIKGPTPRVSVGLWMRQRALRSRLNLTVHDRGETRMKLIRHGEPGEEKPGVILANGSLLDVSVMSPLSVEITTKHSSRLEVLTLLSAGFQQKVQTPRVCPRTSA